MKLFWLSFVDPDLPKGKRFLGVAIVAATEYIEAVKVTHILGINPGGEIRGSELPRAYQVSSQWRERLLSAADVEELERFNR